MTNDEIIIALQRLDKHLWGINATYKEAAKLIGLDNPNKIKKVLFDKARCLDIRTGKVLQTVSEWNGHLQWFKCPDVSGGARSPTLVGRGRLPRTSRLAGSHGIA